jgi:hypothetical protein
LASDEWEKVKKLEGSQVGMFEGHEFLAPENALEMTDCEWRCNQEGTMYRAPTKAKMPR